MCKGCLIKIGSLIKFSSQRSVTESTPHVPFQNTTNDGIALNVQIGRAMTVSKPRHKKAPAEPSWVPFLPGRRKKEIEDRLYVSMLF